MDSLPIDAIYHVNAHLDLASSIRLAATCRRIYHSMIGEDHRRINVVKKQCIDQMAAIEYRLEPVGVAKLRDDYDASDYDSDDEYDLTLDQNNDQISIRVVGDLITAARYKTRPGLYGCDWKPTENVPELIFMSSRRANMSIFSPEQLARAAAGLATVKYIPLFPRGRNPYTDDDYVNVKTSVVGAFRYSTNNNPKTVDGVLDIIRSKYARGNYNAQLIYHYGWSTR